jgi:hypothetical protein
MHLQSVLTSIPHYDKKDRSENRVNGASPMNSSFAKRYFLTILVFILLLSPFVWAQEN